MVEIVIYKEMLGAGFAIGIFATVFVELLVYFLTKELQ
jgi:hypothetical protein